MLPQPMRHPAPTLQYTIPQHTTSRHSNTTILQRPKHQHSNSPNLSNTPPQTALLQLNAHKLSEAPSERVPSKPAANRPCEAPATQQQSRRGSGVAPPHRHIGHPGRLLSLFAETKSEPPISTHVSSMRTTTQKAESSWKHRRSISHCCNRVSRLRARPKGFAILSLRFRLFLRKLATGETAPFGNLRAVAHCQDAILIKLLSLLSGLHYQTALLTVKNPKKRRRNAINCSFSFCFQPIKPQ